MEAVEVGMEPGSGGSERVRASARGAAERVAEALGSLLVVKGLSAWGESGGGGYSGAEEEPAEGPPKATRGYGGGRSSGGREWPPPLTVRLSPRNDRAARPPPPPRPSGGGEETKGTGRQHHHHATAYTPGPCAAAATLFVAPLLSVRGLPVPGPRGGAGGPKDGARGPRPRSPAGGQEMRCHRYQTPPQPLLWHHHRPRNSHQQQVGEVSDLVMHGVGGVEGARILNCTRITLSPKSPAGLLLARGPWDDLIYWEEDLAR